MAINVTMKETITKIKKKWSLIFFSSETFEEKDFWFTEFKQKLKQLI